MPYNTNDVMIIVGIKNIINGMKMNRQHADSVDIQTVKHNGHANILQMKLLNLSFKNVG